MEQKKKKKKKKKKLVIVSGVVVILVSILIFTVVVLMPIMTKQAETEDTEETTEETSISSGVNDVEILNEPMLEETDEADPTCYIYDITELHGGVLPLEALGDIDRRIETFLKSMDYGDVTVLEIEPKSTKKEGMVVTFRCSMKERPEEMLHVTYDYKQSDFSFYIEEK